MTRLLSYTVLRPNRHDAGLDENYSVNPSVKLRPRSQSNRIYNTSSVMQPASCRFILIFVKIIPLTIFTEQEENPPSGIASLPDYSFLDRFAIGGRWGISSPKPLAWGCYPQTPSSLRAFHPIFLLQNSMRIVFAGTSAGGCPYDLRGKSDEWNACSCAPGRTAV